VSTEDGDIAAVGRKPSWAQKAIDISFEVVDGAHRLTYGLEWHCAHPKQEKYSKCYMQVTAYHSIVY
jgi:hypothetical protein